MNPETRIRLLRLSEMLNRNAEYADRLGISVRTERCDNARGGNGTV